MRALRKGLQEEAKQRWINAAILDPAYWEPQGRLGELFAQTEQPALALEHFERALVLEPNSPALLYNAARTLLALNRPGEAESAARRAVQLSPALVEAHWVLGLALVQGGKPTREAADHLSVAATRYPEVRARLGWVREHEQIEFALRPVLPVVTGIAYVQCTHPGTQVTIPIEGLMPGTVYSVWYVTYQPSNRSSLFVELETLLSTGPNPKTVVADSRGAGLLSTQTATDPCWAEGPFSTQVIGAIRRDGQPHGLVEQFRLTFGRER
jgi:tetratricopeptide (TPR) repeat protein